MFTDRIRFVFLRMLDREGLLDVTPYHITLHEVYSKLGYTDFGTEPCNINEYNSIYDYLINSFKEQKERLKEQQEEAFKRVNFNILGRDFTLKEKEHLKEILGEKYNQLDNYIDKQKNIATNIFFDDLKKYIYEEYGKLHDGKIPEEEAKNKILEDISNYQFKNGQELIKGLKIKFFDLD